MKFLILISLLSTGIFKASGGSLNGNSLSQSINSLLASLHIPGYATSRSALEAPTPQIVYLNTYPVNTAPYSDSPDIRQPFSSPLASIQRVQDDSEVIDANESPITANRELSEVASRSQNLVSSITGKFGNLVAKTRRLLGLGSPRNAAFGDINGLSRQSASNDDLLNQIIGNQISAFFATIRDAIRARIQNANLSIKSKRQGASRFRSNGVTEMEHELTALDILYQIFQSPEALLQVLPQLIGQTPVASSRAGFNGFESSPLAYQSRAINLFNRTWSKPGGIGSKTISSSSSSGTPGTRQSFLSGLTSSLKPSTPAPAAGHRFFFFGPLTTTTTTAAPVDGSRGTKLFNRLLSKTGLGGDAGAGASMGK